jgi:hypothetical protein
MIAALALLACSERTCELDGRSCRPGEAQVARSAIADENADALEVRVPVRAGDTDVCFVIEGTVPSGSDTVAVGGVGSGPSDDRTGAANGWVTSGTCEADGEVRWALVDGAVEVTAERVALDLDVGRLTDEALVGRLRWTVARAE